MNETISDIDSIIQLSKDSDTLGFDLRAGTSWIYPTNYPVRDYQYNITQAALHQNTLVSLPTGLGKTFIAAVIMYNFYRWYPMGKIIFMAPTKPLVTQQMEACYKIMAIPKNVSVEMTGAKINTSRAKLWEEKRVFFITPHILQNDIDSVLELAPQIRCIVIDEAHKALGRNANCEAIKKIEKINPNFRVLALSATPGSNFNSIKDVITNLLICHIEVRTNESIDVAPYVFQRKLDKYVIPITGKLMAVKNEYIKILDRYTRPLLQHNIFTGNCANLTKGRIVLTMKEFKERGRHHKQYGFILKTLNICVTIYHGYELLIRHGLRAFLQFFKENISKPLINAIGELHGVIDDIDQYLGPLDNIEMLPDGTIPEITGNLVYSHPKFEKLSQVLKSHFNQIKDADTKVMVFCEYRESVMEIYTLLLRHRPLIKPRIFLGQGAISQAQQLQAVRMFKSGQCNTLVSTCIGEEGLDVGEVDLIVCFDISSKSPIRMVQRMGRTGRKRDGRVVILVTEGKEEQLLSECLVQRNNMNTLLESQQIKTHLYKRNPKMIPEGTIPKCNKMYITVSEPEKPTKKKVERKNTKKNNNTTNSLKNMFNNITSSQSSSKSNDDNNTTSTSTKTSLKKNASSTKKQASLKSMFTKINKTQINIIPEVIIVEEEEEQSESSVELNELISNIKNYLDTSFTSSGCTICNNLFDCETIINNINNTPIKKQINWDDFNSSIFDKITEDSLKIFTQSLQPKISKINYKKSFSDDLEKTFEFFKINSTFDLFSDNSAENECDNSFVVNPVIFNQSTRIFNNSRVYETQNENNFAPSPTDLFNSTDDENMEKNKTPVKIHDPNDIIVGSSSEKSPVLNKSRFRQFGAQRRLFSQTSSIDSNISKDFKQLENTIDSIITTQQNPNNETIKKFVSTPKIKSPSKFSFIPKINETTENLTKTEEPDKTKNITSSTATTEPQNNLHDTNFWDESLFEICDSDDAFEMNDIENNVNKDKEQKNNTQENINNVSNDSDETIILSFNSDDIFKNIEKENLIQNTNTSNLLNDKSQTQIDCDKIDHDQSLLSITQMIDLFNKTEHDQSLKINETNNTQNTKTQIVENSSKPDEPPINDLIIIDDDILKECEKSDEERSLLCFSQNIRRKVDDKPQRTILKDTNINKSEFLFPSSSSQLNLKNRHKKMKLSTKGNISKNENVSSSQTQNSPLKITKKKFISKEPIVLSDSDDDFEFKPPKRKESVCKVTPEKKFKRIKSVTEIGSVLSTKNPRRTTLKQTKTSGGCDFLDIEAVVSIDEHYESDSEEENDSMLESSFIHDSQSQSVLDQTDMQAKYLQSIRSPKTYNPFKRPQLPTDINIFSQVENNEDNTYMVDSFCVDSDTTLTERHGLSYLEMVEAQLEKKVKKEKKRKRLRTVTEDSD